MRITPTFNGRTTGWSSWKRKCFRCGRTIGRKGKSYDYMPMNHPSLHVCPPCHRRCTKPGCAHRIFWPAKKGRRKRP